MNGPIELGWLTLIGAAGLILVNAGLSIWLRLGLERRLAIASVRTVVQLLLLGLHSFARISVASTVPGRRVSGRHDRHGKSRGITSRRTHL